MIVGYTGLVGHGKTMLGVQEALRVARRRGAILASNIEIVAPDLDVRRLAVAEQGLDEVASLFTDARASGKGIVLFVDEIGIVLPSRFWQTATSIDLMWACSQSRKLGADLIFTCQHITQLDAFLRRITDWVYKVWCFPYPSLDRREDGKRPWLIRRTQWLPTDVEGLRPEKRMGASWLRYRREWESVYNTDELVRPPAKLLGTPGESRRRSGNPPGSSPEVKETDASGSGAVTPAGAQARERSDGGGAAVDIDGIGSGWSPVLVAGGPGAVGGRQAAAPRSAAGSSANGVGPAASNGDQAAGRRSRWQPLIEEARDELGDGGELRLFCGQCGAPIGGCTCSR